MKICTISVLVGPALQELGHEVLNFWPRQTTFDLPKALAEHSFVPDLVFQEESLGARVILKGLQHIPCPKTFWSLDTHLNLFWHAHYCRLFDGILTPHVSILQKALRAPHPALGRMAMFGAERPWKPFAQRRHDVSFVGRITEHRPLRTWLARFLEERYNAAVVQDLTFAGMLDLYGDTRLAPNESLLSEVNYRLIEAASCGCLVLSQDVGPDQDVLFTRGKEMETYAHVLELKALLDHHLARPEQAERMARAAWERVNREHLLRHRCQSLLNFAAGLSPAGLRGQDAEAAYWLSLAHMQRAGMLPASPQGLEQTLGMLAPTPEVLAARITLLTESHPRDAALEFLYRILAENAHTGDLDVNLAGSMAGIFLDDWSIAKQFWYRHTAARAPGGAVALKDPAHLCVLWAKELMGAERNGSAGFRYDATAHLPKAAVECLYLAQRLAPADLEITRRLAALTAALRGHEYIRLGHLSHLTLHSPKDWRTGLQLGLANLKAFRLEAGLEETGNALANAAGQGKEDSFFSALSAFDPKGHVLAALKEREGPA